MQDMKVTLKYGRPCKEQGAWSKSKVDKSVVRDLWGNKDLGENHLN